MTLSVLDLALVALFFAVVFGIGVWDRSSVDIDAYFVNRRKTNRFILVATTLSTFVGAGSILSNASFAFKGGGLATFVVPLSFSLYGLVFARFFAPKIKEFGDTHGAFSVPDYLRITYSGRTALAGAAVILVSWALFLAVQMLAMGTLVATLSGIDPVLATVVGGIVVITYTSVGGLQADIRTDVFQFIIMMFLLMVFLPLLLWESGGLEGIMSLPREVLTGEKMLSPLVAACALCFYGAGIITSSDMWQRSYAGDSKAGVRWAMTMTSGLILAFMAMGTLFGLCGRILLPDVDPNLIVPKLMQSYLPAGIYGLVLAGFFAAIMSTADSVLLVTSMTIVHDIGVKHFGWKLDMKQMLKASRYVTFGVGAVGLAAALIVFSLVHLSIEASSFYVALLPSVVFGFYGRKKSERASFYSIVIGFVTIAAFLKIDPISAFIPGLIVSFLTYLGVSKFFPDTADEFRNNPLPPNP